MFWPSHLTRILCHTPNGSFVSNSDGTCPKIEPHVHVGFEKLSQELSTDVTYKFINGLLDALRKQERNNDPAEEQA